MVGTITQILAFGILIANIFIGALIILYIIKLIAGYKLFDHLVNFIRPYAFTLSFLTALASLIGSLFFSEIAKFQPCTLCWYQRIFMYPLPLLLYIAIIKKDITIRPYIIAMSVVGIVIAIYHYFIQLFPESSPLPCEAFSPVSCVKGYTFYYGFISIPFMSATAFLLIIILLSIVRQNKNA